MHYFRHITLLAIVYKNYKIFKTQVILESQKNSECRHVNIYIFIYFLEYVTLFKTFDKYYLCLNPN